MPLDARAWRDQLGALVRDRPVILTATVIASTRASVEQLRGLGAGPILVIGGAQGAGPGPDPEHAEVVELGITGASLLDSIRRVLAMLDDPPASVRDVVETFDPERRALVLGELFNASPTFLGRPYLAARRPEWVALEDKVVVDDFWDRAGVARSSSRVVPITRRALAAVLDDFPGPDGIVVAADASAGWHGGAEFVRRVRPDHRVADIDAVLADFGGAATARAMPFVPGVPCSIHGIVFDEAVVALRPVELLVLTTASGRFFYSGCATFFDPPVTDRDAMREIARRVGRRLRDEVGFRGAFTIDGVLGADGFVPTELNPRNGAGMRPLTQAIELPMQLLLDSVVAGAPIDWHVEELEALLIESADAHRAGATAREFPIRLEPAQGDLVLDRGEFRLPAVGEPPDLRFEIAQGSMGSVVRGFPAVERQPVGKPFGPVAAAFWRWADRTQALGLEPMEPPFPPRPLAQP